MTSVKPLKLVRLKRGWYGSVCERGSIIKMTTYFADNSKKPVVQWVVVVRCPSHTMRYYEPTLAGARNVLGSALATLDKQAIVDFAAKMKRR